MTQETPNLMNVEVWDGLESETRANINHKSRNNKTINNDYYFITISFNYNATSQNEKKAMEIANKYNEHCSFIFRIR